MDKNGASSSNGVHKIGNDLPFIEGREITKGFNNSGSRIEILKFVDFTIEAGETLAVVGASGIGKSTFLNVLGTLDRADSGKLCFEGEDLWMS